jgi:hypothetical protein
LLQFKHATRLYNKHRHPLLYLRPPTLSAYDKTGVPFRLRILDYAYPFPQYPRKENSGKLAQAAAVTNKQAKEIAIVLLLDDGIPGPQRPPEADQGEFDRIGQACQMRRAHWQPLLGSKSRHRRMQRSCPGCVLPNCKIL